MHVDIRVGGLMERVFPLPFDLHQLAKSSGSTYAGMHIAGSTHTSKHTFSLPMRSFVRRRLMFVSAGTLIVGPNMATDCSSPRTPALYR